MQRLHDKVRGNWQKFTTMVYELNKSRDLKAKEKYRGVFEIREQEIIYEKKFLNLR